MTATKALVKWKDELSEDDTWEFYHELKTKYHSFHSWEQKYAEIFLFIFKKK